MLAASTETSFRALLDNAHQAGLAAVASKEVEPMVVTDGTRSYYIPDGPCGFAWISFPANTPFGRYCKKVGIASRHYPSGLCIWVSLFNQSMQKKEIYAFAFARVLQDAGIVKCYAGSRMD